MISTIYYKGDGCVQKDRSFTTKNGTKVEIYELRSTDAKKGLIARAKKVTLSNQNPLKKAGIDAIVYGTGLGRFIPGYSDPKVAVPIDGPEPSLKELSEIVAVDKYGNILADGQHSKKYLRTNGQAEVKDLISNIKEHGLIVKSAKETVSHKIGRMFGKLMKSCRV